MSEEQNEVLEQQRHLLERRMYRLDPAPPKLPAQEYIVRYLTEKEDKYLAWYLHDQEPALNELAQAACERYAMTEHFADIKQAAVCGILAALQKYDPAIGAPFAAFQKRYIQDGVGDYIRTAQSGVITMTADTYPVMRRIMAIYHLNGDDCSDSCIQRIADETGMGEKSVRKYITIGTLNERRVDFYRQYDEDGEETAEDISVDTTSQPDKMYFRAVLYDALHQAYGSLTYREQRTVAKHLGFCDTCWSVRKAVLINGEIEYKPIKPMTFEEISHSASRKSDKASERTYNNALEKMRKALLSYPYRLHAHYWHTVQQMDVAVSMHFDKNGSKKRVRLLPYLSATPEPVVTPKRGLQKSHQQMTLKIKNFTNIVKLFLTYLSYGDILCLTIFIK